MKDQHQGPKSFEYGTSLNQEFRDFADLALKSRFLQAMESGSARYAIHRELRFAAREELDLLFDDLALNLGCRVQRLNAWMMILEDDSVFVTARGGRGSGYCSCKFGIWAQTPERVRANEVGYHRARRQRHYSGADVFD